MKENNESICCKRLAIRMKLMQKVAAEVDYANESTLQT